MTKQKRKRWLKNRVRIQNRVRTIDFNIDFREHFVRKGILVDGCSVQKVQKTT